MVGLLACSSSNGESSGNPDAGPDAGPMSTNCRPESLPGEIGEGAWDPGFTVAGVTGPDGDAPHVTDFARDTDGTVLAAGRFRWLGSTRVEPLLRADQGGQWTAGRRSWELEVPEFGGLSAVAVGPAGELALATTGLAPEIWVDTGAGLIAVAALSQPSGFFQYVRSLAWFDGALWAAGSFTLADPGISHLAVWDGTSWSSPPGGAADGPVYELLVANDSLFAAGNFANMGGIAARAVAAWDGTSWTPFDMVWPQPPLVFSLAMDDEGNLAAGGIFTDEPAEQCASRGSVAEWNGTAWEILDGGVSMPDATCGAASAPGWVYDVAFHRGDLYVTGVFTHAGGPVMAAEAIPMTTFARRADGEWQSLDGSAPLGVASPWVHLGLEGTGFHGQRLLSDGDRLLAGILVPGAGGVPSQGLIAYEDGEWTAQGPAAGLGLQGSSFALAVGGPNCDLHVLGEMTHAAGRAVESPALRFEDGGWAPIGGALPPDLTCVRGIAVDSRGTVYLACDRTDGSGAVEVLGLEGDEWTSLGSPPADGTVRALVVDGGDTLWAVGGVFGEKFGDSSGFVARRIDGAWELVADDADGPVTDIAFASDDGGVGDLSFVVGGDFTRLGGADLAHVAGRQGGAWTALGTGLASRPSALEYGRRAIYASELGDGSSAGLRVGRFSGAEWVDLATADREFPDLAVTDVQRIVEVGDSLVVAGTLLPGQFPPRERMVLVFDEDRFSWLAGGIGANFVLDAAVTSDGIWFAGAIAEAGLDAGGVSSVGIARYGWPE